MAIPDDSGSNVIRLVGAHDLMSGNEHVPPGTPRHAVPLEGPRGFVDIRSRSRRGRHDLLGDHLLEYRSLHGRRLKVDATCTLDRAHYVQVPTHDTMSKVGDQWRHEGESTAGRRGWTRVLANYVRGSERLPTVLVDVEVSSDAPLERVIRARRRFEIA